MRVLSWLLLLLGLWIPAICEDQQQEFVRDTAIADRLRTHGVAGFVIPTDIQKRDQGALVVLDQNLRLAHLLVKQHPDEQSAETDPITEALRSVFIQKFAEQSDPTVKTEIFSSGLYAGMLMTKSHADLVHLREQIQMALSHERPLNSSVPGALIKALERGIQTLSHLHQFLSDESLRTDKAKMTTGFKRVQAEWSQNRQTINDELSHMGLAYEKTDLPLIFRGLEAFSQLDPPP